MAKRSRKRPAPNPPKPPEPVAAPAQTAPNRLVLMAGIAALVAAAGGAYFFWGARPSRPVAVAPAAAERLIAGSADYVDPAACAGCHAEIAATYAETGMGRSFYPATPERMRAHLGDGPAEYEHAASGRRYELFEREGVYYLKREADDVPPLELRIDFVMGSGNHARSYLHRLPDGRLLEAPVGWYAPEGAVGRPAPEGFLAMSPGFDAPRHGGVRREISFDCIACHNGYPEIAPGADAPGRDPQFAGRLPQGIDCQRCHGPGRAHVEAVAAGGSEAEVREAILNPASLPVDRQLEVCLQCHLESTSRRLPYSIHRFDRAKFSYRPDEPLADAVLHFDHPDGVREDKFEIAHHAYRLRKSACFRESGSMTCTTCHDPHQVTRGEAGLERQRAICRDCHGQGFEDRVAAGSHPADGDCLGCHMPKRRTEDVVNVVMTDHFIQRRPPSNPLAPLAERVEGPGDLYRGPVELYYPAELPATPENELYEAVAQVIEQTNLEAGIPRLRELLERYRPAQGEFYFHLAEAYWSQERYDDALPWYEQAVQRAPDHLVALRNYGVSLSRTGQWDAAEAMLRRALDVEPDDVKALINLAEVLNSSGKPTEAAAALARALARDPLSPEAHQNLALSRSRLGDAAGAEEAAREALRIEPGFVGAHNTLGNVLADQNRLDEAERHFRRAIELDPAFAEAHYNYGNLLADLRRFDEAERQMREAVRLDPDLVPARVNLGGLLALRGATEQALAEFRRAIEADPGYAPAHYNLGTAYGRMNRAEEARTAFAEAVRLDPGYLEARLNYGITLAALGEIAAAREQLEVAAQGSDPVIKRTAENVLGQLGE